LTENDTNENGSREFLLLSVLLTVLIYVASVAVIRTIGWVPHLTKTAWWGLSASVLAIIIKMLFGDLVKGDNKIDWAQHGYDLCIMTLGTSLITVAYQFASSDINGKALLIPFITIGLTLLGVVLAGGNLNAIEKGKAKRPGFLKALNICAGVVAISLNVLIIVTKEPVR
jgi:hypothetical protein